VAGTARRRGGSDQRQPARAVDGRAAERRYERGEEVEAGRDRDGRERAEDLESPVVEADEPPVLTDAGRTPEPR
jgi:hypothetical protein